MREQARSTNNIKDITPFLGPIRAIVLFYGGRRRQGDVALFCELSVAGKAVEGFRLVVCVVDIVHGPTHDISRGGAFFLGPSERRKSCSDRSCPAMRNICHIQVG